MPKIAVIGAGVSGLAAAFQLAETEAEVCLFEKSKGVSGRAASRTKNGCRYDHGANYFKLNCNEIARLLFERLPTDGLCRVLGDIRPFDEHGTIGEGDPAQNAAAKWTYREGISTLGKLLAEMADLNIRRETQIEKLIHDGDWNLHDTDARKHGPFDAVILTAPGPQTVALLESGEVDGIVVAPLIKELRRARYHCQFSVVLNYAGTHELPGGAYALINSDRRHSLAWLSHENRKRERIPEGETVFVAQMAPDWSQDHYNAETATIIEAANSAVTELVGDLPRPEWADTQRWRYAHPHSAASLEAMKPGAEIGLFFAGDAFIGKGRIPRALETGIAAARQIEQYFDL